MPKPLNLPELSDQRPFEITDYEGKSQKWISPALRNNDFTILWLIDGSGQLRIDFVDYSMMPGQVVTMVPGQTYEGVMQYNKLIVMRLRDGFFDHRYRTRLLFMKTFFPGNGRGALFELSSMESDHLLQLAGIMVHEQQKKAVDWDLQAHLASAFLTYLSHCNHKTPVTNKLDERVIELLILINRYFCKERNASFYARKFSLTRKRLNELTKKQLNKTVTQLVHDRIILEARRVLIYDTKTVKAISYELGFADSAYFCRFYKRQTGESPMAFRKATLK